MADENKQSGIAALRNAEKEILAAPPTPDTSKGPIEGELILLDETLNETGPAGAAPDAPVDPVAPVAPVVPAQGTEVTGEYQPPVTEELQPPVDTKVVEEGKDTKEPGSQEAEGFDVTPELVAKGEMVAPSRSAVSSVLLARIAKHMGHLKGDRGFGTNKERWEEQASFMECIGRSTTLPFDDYVLVTDELIKEIRANLKLFTSGDCFRFMYDLTSKYPENSPVKYPRENTERYQAYIAFLTTIARNYTTRNRLRTSTDVAFATKDMQTVSKQNVVKFFNKITSN